MTDFIRNYRTLAGMILELSDVYGNKTMMTMPTEMVSKIVADDIKRLRYSIIVNILH